MSTAMKRLLTIAVLATGCASAPEIKDDRPPVPLEPVAVRPVFIPEKDELFALVDPLKPIAEEKLSSMGHAISDRGWPVEIQLRSPETGTCMVTGIMLRSSIPRLLPIFLPLYFFARLFF